MPKSIYLPKAKKSAGFTLVELMIVVAIIAIIAGLTFNNLNSSTYRLKSTAKILKANMQKARLLAVKENHRVYVDFDFNGDNIIDKSYTLWKDLNNNGTYDDATTDNNGDGAVNNLDEELIETVSLPRGISFGAVTAANGGPANSPSGGATPATTIISYAGKIMSFSPQGTSGSGWIYLHATSNNEAGTYAIGTNNIGRVQSSYYATEGGGWH